MLLQFYSKIWAQSFFFKADDKFLQAVKTFNGAVCTPQQFSVGGKISVENILAAPKLPSNSEKDYLKKKNYGKVPKFLQKIKGEIEDEY